MPLIHRDYGARQLAQYWLVLSEARSPFYRSAADVTVFVLQGSGVVDIAGERYQVNTHSATLIKAGELFGLEKESDEVLQLLLTVCPGEQPLLSSAEPVDGQLAIMSGTQPF